MTILTYFRSYLAMSKHFGQSYMKKFDIAENLIDEGMLIAQESSSGDTFIFENVTKMPKDFVYGSNRPEKSFDLIFASVFLFIFLDFFFKFFQVLFKFFV